MWGHRPVPGHTQMVPKQPIPDPGLAFRAVRAQRARWFEEGRHVSRVPSATKVVSVKGGRAPPGGGGSALMGRPLELQLDFAAT